MGRSALKLDKGQPENSLRIVHRSTSRVHFLPAIRLYTRTAQKLFSWQAFALTRNRLIAGSPLYFVRGGSWQNTFTIPFRDRPGWIGYTGQKNNLWTVHNSTFRDVFLSGISYSSQLNAKFRDKQSSWMAYPFLQSLYSAHQHAFPYSNKVVSTLRHLRWPVSLQKGMAGMSSSHWPQFSMHGRLAWQQDFAATPVGYNKP